jgi:hypothetical protein
VLLRKTYPSMEKRVGAPKKNLSIHGEEDVVIVQLFLTVEICLLLYALRYFRAFILKKVLLKPKFRDRL